MSVEKTVWLYTTEGCHLCSQAETLLRQVLPGDWVVQHVDVADDDALLEAYGERIPVVHIGTTELAWPFGLLDVQQAVRG